jgi:hypothetical protein
MHLNLCNPPPPTPPPLIIFVAFIYYSYSADVAAIADLEAAAADVAAIAMAEKETTLRYDDGAPPSRSRRPPAQIAKIMDGVPATYMPEGESFIVYCIWGPRREIRFVRLCIYKFVRICIHAFVLNQVRGKTGPAPDGTRHPKGRGAFRPRNEKNCRSQERSRKESAGKMFP